MSAQTPYKSQSQNKSRSQNDQVLHRDMLLAAGGDKVAIERLLTQLGPSAWTVGFLVADAVGSAADAMAEGFLETLQLFDDGINVEDVRLEVLHATRRLAIESAHAGAGSAGENGRHAREPIPLLGEAEDHQATLALTALPEPVRTALWLSETQNFSISRLARLLDESYSNTEDFVRRGRVNFRRNYVDAIRRNGHNTECRTALDRLSAYIGHNLSAGDTTGVEHHLSRCSECRTVVSRLEDLEGRLVMAIPSAPAWARQMVIDQWDQMTSGFMRKGGQRTNLWALGTQRRPVLVSAAILAISAIAGGVLMTTSANENVSRVFERAATRHSTSNQSTPSSTPSTTASTAPESQEGASPTPANNPAAAEPAPGAQAPLPSDTNTGSLSAPTSVATPQPLNIAPAQLPIAVPQTQVETPVQVPAPVNPPTPPPTPSTSPNVLVDLPPIPLIQ